MLFSKQYIIKAHRAAVKLITPDSHSQCAMLQHRRRRLGLKCQFAIPSMLLRAKITTFFQRIDGGVTFIEARFDEMAGAY